MIQLSDEQFRSAAMIGLGRAILFAQQEGRIPDEETARHIMLHNTAYDPQVEGTRSWYTVQLLECAASLEIYQLILREEIERTPPSDDWDEWHRLAIVGKFAEDSSSDMRGLLYDRTAANIKVGSNAGITELVIIDGASGINFVVDRFTNSGFNLADLYYAIESGIEHQPNLASLPIVEKIRKLNEAEMASRKSSRSQIETYEDFQKLLDENPEKFRYSAGKWVMKASDAELQDAAAKFLSTPPSGHDQLLAYLSVFAKRAFPLDPTPLIELARKYDGGPTRADDGKIITSQFVPFRAFVALAKVNQPTVRDFALETIQSRAVLDRAVDLLENNYQPGDWSLISEVVQRQHPSEVLHSIGMSVRTIATKYPSPEASSSLNYLIERDPCSNCRFDLLKLSHDLGSLPALAREESLFDSNEDTREWASGFTN